MVGIPHRHVKNTKFCKIKYKYSIEKVFDKVQVTMLSNLMHCNIVTNCIIVKIKSRVVLGCALLSSHPDFYSC